MIDLKEIIHSFTDENRQEFINYLDKKNKRKDAKNIQLVNLLMEDHFSNKEICIQLYQRDNKVALHALRKRLFQSIIDFTANTNIKEENSTDIQLIKFIISARAFLKKGQYAVGYRILDKAEIVANDYQLFSILNEIYHTKIEYAHHIDTINFDDLVNRFKENQQQHQLEERLNIAYAKIRIVLNTINHQQKVVNIKDVINRILQENCIEISESLSFKSFYQIIQIANLSSAQNFDYWNIEDFLLETYKLLKNHKVKDKQLFYHIEILYVIANTLFRNKKFEDSLAYLDVMNLYMHKDRKKYFKEYELKYVLLLSLNYNYIGNQDFAINLISPFVAKSKAKHIVELDIHLVLIVFYSQQNQLEKASHLLAKLYRTDKWYIEKAGIIWTIEKNLIEILVHIDLGNINFVESRLKSFKRNYTKHLKDNNQQRVLTYLNLIETYYKNPEIVTSLDFSNKVERAFDWLEKSKEDIFMMSFFAWLKAKMTKQNVYAVTLDLVNN